MEISKIMLQIVATQAANEEHLKNIDEKIDALQEDITALRNDIVGNKTDELKRWHKVVMIIVPALLGSGGISFLMKIFGG
jgi:hypothetical protein